MANDFCIPEGKTGASPKKDVPDHVHRSLQFFLKQDYNASAAIRIKEEVKFFLKYQEPFCESDSGIELDWPLVEILIHRFLVFKSKGYL